MILTILSESLFKELVAAFRKFSVTLKLPKAFLKILDLKADYDMYRTLEKINQ